MLKSFKNIAPVSRSMVNFARAEMIRGPLELRVVSSRFSSTSHKAEAIDGRRAAHCMFWARTQSTAIGNTPMKALIMMQVNSCLTKKKWSPIYGPYIIGSRLKSTNGSCDGNCDANVR